MTRISTGAVSVANGEALVTDWVGDDGVVLSEITSPADSQVVIEGVANFIKTRLTSTTFELLLPHSGPGGADLLCAISALTAKETTVGTLNSRLAATAAQLDVLDANSQGLFFRMIAPAGNVNPGPGNFCLNINDPAAVTEAYISKLDANAAHHDVSALLGLFGIGTQIITRSLIDAAYLSFEFTGTIIDEGEHYRAPLKLIGPAGVLGPLVGEPISVSWVRSGKGLAFDESGSLAERADFDDEAGGFVYMSREGAGTVLYVKQSLTTADWGAGFPLTGPRGYAGWTQRFATVNDGARRLRQLIGYAGGEGPAPTTSIGWYESPTGLVEDKAAASDWRGPAGANAYQVAVTDGFAGDVAAWRVSLVGDDAYKVAVAQGFVGDKSAWLSSLHGADGTGPGVLLIWDDGGALADPGSGKIRAVGADLGAALQLVVSKTNAAGDSIEPLLLSLADSTNVRKGQITLTRAGGNAQAFFGLASITNGAGFVVLNLVPDSQGGAPGFIDDNAIWFQFWRDGNAGGADLASVISATNTAPAKTAPVATDKLLIADSEDSFAGKSGLLGSLRDAIGTLAHGQIIKTDSYTIVAGDVGLVVLANKATPMTFSFDPAASLGDDFAVVIKNIGTGLLTLDPNGSELIDTAATKAVRAGESLLVTSNGVGLRTLFAGFVFGGDAGSGGFSGLVPAPGAGDAAAGKFLKADGTWASVSSVAADLEVVLAEVILELADKNGAALFLGASGNRFGDSFKTLTNVDVAGATNLDSSTAGLLKPTLAGGVISGATGANIGNMTGQGGLVAAFNGVTNAVAAANSAGLTGTTNQAYVGKTYSGGKAISQAVAYGSNDTGFFNGGAGWVLELWGKQGAAPASASDGTLLGSLAYTDGTNESAGRTIASSNTTTVWDHVWLRPISTASAPAFVVEVVFYEPVTANNLTVRSTAFAAAAVPTKMKALLQVKEVDAATAGADYTLECSRDGGTTWSTMTLTELYTMPSGLRVVEAVETSVAGQPSGTAPCWRFKTLNKKNVELHDVYLYWS